MEETRNLVKPLIPELFTHRVELEGGGHADTRVESPEKEKPEKLISGGQG